MPTLYAEIDINAPQSVVWEALIRKDQWRFWNTFFYDCDPGLQIARGNEIFLAIQRLEGDEETEIQPVVTMLRSPYIMKWVSTIPGLKSEHVFELRETVPGRTQYLHRETFSGVLSKVFLPFIRQDERRGMRRMAQQLKMHVESGLLGNGYPMQRQPQRDFYPQPRPQQYGGRYGSDYYGGDRYRDDYYRGESRYEERPYSNRTQGNNQGNRPYYDQPYSNQPYAERDYRTGTRGNSSHGSSTAYNQPSYNEPYKAHPRSAQPRQQSAPPPRIPEQSPPDGPYRRRNDNSQSGSYEGSGDYPQYNRDNYDQNYYGGNDYDTRR